MAKAKPKEKSSASSLEQTALLARKLLAVPKTEADKEERKYQKKRKLAS